jgi:hypothetical protein
VVQNEQEFPSVLVFGAGRIDAVLATVFLKGGLENLALLGVLDISKRHWCLRSLKRDAVTIFLYRVYVELAADGSPAFNN